MQQSVRSWAPNDRNIFCRSQILKYSDTNNRKVYVNAIGKAVPPKKEESGDKKEGGGEAKK